MSEDFRYVYTDDDYDSMVINAHRVGGERVASVKTGMTVYIPAGRLPEVVAALYRAAGKPEPVILDRLTRKGCDQVTVAGVRTYLADSGLIGIEGSRLGDDLAPVEAWHLATRIASLVVIADSEPDPAEVQSLADEMYSDVRRLGGPPPEEWRVAARAVLRWMRGREMRP